MPAFCGIAPHRLQTTITKEVNDMAKNVLITGASAGFGDLISRTLVDKGYNVFATMRDPAGRNSERAASLSSYAEGKPGRLHVLELDVTSDDSVGRAVSRAIELEGPLHVVVNNAGIGAGGLNEGFTPEQWQQVFDVNVFGVQRVTRAALPSMRERGEGLFINVSSVMGRIVIPFAAPYTATKYALEGMSESLRYELSGVGVDVAIVEPGGFMTEFASRMLSPQDADRVDAYGPVKELPDKLWGGFMEQLGSDDGPDPQELADAVLGLIETPAGERPLRVVVDPMTGGEAAHSVNRATEQAQEQLLNGFQMGELSSVK
jgi:NAD(P)-dependent dehydrogenase (short-subunit alcohol dehydrogenase family)